MCAQAETDAEWGKTNKEFLRELAEGVQPPQLTVEQFEAVELDRVRVSLYMALVCESIPRRLGKDADPWAQAMDKKIARQVANLYRTAWAMLDRHTAPAWHSRRDRLAMAAMADPVARRVGATVRWGDWLRGRYSELLDIARAAAALSVAQGRMRWGAGKVRLLGSERANIRRIINQVVKGVEDAKTGVRKRPAWAREAGS